MRNSTPMQLQDILYSQGFGTRRICAGLIQQGWVAVHSAGSLEPVVCLEPAQNLKEQGLVLRVQGQDWPYHAKAYVMLNKPATECSRSPLPIPACIRCCPPLRQRPGKSA
ncbi:pseudouridine synthase Rsu [Alicycliphilus sp. B1]|nr:pseudouridine synthase Rsu [Alicycliphilus sp. B1]